MYPISSLMAVPDGRHSSAPMEPPAPVTSTRLPRNMPLTALTSVRTGARRSRSSIRDARPSQDHLSVGVFKRQGCRHGLTPQPVGLE
jgi:hypothetical protein